MNEEVFASFTDERRKLAIWRYDDKAARPHSALNGDTPTYVRRALEQTGGLGGSPLAIPTGPDLF